MFRKTYVYHDPIEIKYKALYGVYPFDDKEFTQEKIDKAWKIVKEECERKRRIEKQSEEERLFRECPFI